MKTNYQIHSHTSEVEDSSKYLGVTISQDLAWKKHIDNTVNKANRTLGFIRHNLGDCTAPVKAAAYSTLVRLVLEYSYTVWNLHQASDIHNLEQVQSRASCFVHYNYTDEHQNVSPTCLFVLLLYVPSQQLRSWRDSQFTYSHFFLGTLTSTSCTHFRL